MKTVGYNSLHICCRNANRLYLSDYAYV